MFSVRMYISLTRRNCPFGLGHLSWKPKHIYQIAFIRKCFQIQIIENSSQTAINNTEIY